MENLQAYWTKRYEEGRTGWNIGYPSTPIKEYFDQLENKDVNILIPGAGNAYEAEYLFQQGFQHVHVLDIARPPLDAFQERVPDFPADQLLHGDFFSHEATYDIIVEQTFFCALEPKPVRRKQYTAQMHRLLKTNGKLVGLLFKHPLDLTRGRPFGGSLTEYQSYFEEVFDMIYLENCYNSIPPRMGNEYFMMMRKRS